MTISYTTRTFYPDELRLLRALKKKKEKQPATKIKFYHYLIAGVLAAGFGYLTSICQNGFQGFIPATLTLFLASFVVFTPYEMYKAKKGHKKFLVALDQLIDDGTVATCRIKATRIAIAEEYEDEGNLFIIEIDKNSLLCLWDYDYTLQKKFPCLDFELYERKYTKFGRMIYPLSERITPLPIDKKAKWGYMKKVGSPGHLEVIKADFDQFISEINSCIPTA